MRYPGGKNIAGTYQRIINQIPPHDVYIEPFAGSAAIRRLMRPCRQSLLIDKDRSALDALAGAIPPGTELRHGCALEWLDALLGTEGITAEENWKTLVYLDPPYLQSVCMTRLRYRFILSEEEHYRLLRRCKQLRCHVLISGYRSELYNRELADWRRIDWMQITRGGAMQEESLWCNFPEAVRLHDYAYLGDGYRQRENLRRQQKRWKASLGRMTPLQRQALLSVIDEAYGEPGRIGESGEARAALVDPNGGNGDGRPEIKRSLNGKAAGRARAKKRA